MPAFLAAMAFAQLSGVNSAPLSASSIQARVVPHFTLAARSTFQQRCGTSRTASLTPSGALGRRCSHSKAGLLKAGRAETVEAIDWTLLLKGTGAAKKEGLSALVWWTKVLGGVLATETALTKRGHNTATDTAGTCKLCGMAEESGWHMMAECTGCPQVMASRHQMIDGVHAALAKHLPLGSDALLALR